MEPSASEPSRCCALLVKAVNEYEIGEGRCIRMLRAWVTQKSYLSVRFFVLRKSLGKLLISSCRPVASVSGDTKSPKRRCIPRIQSAAAKIPIPTAGSPFSMRWTVFRLTIIRSAISRNDRCRRLRATARSRPSFCSWSAATVGSASEDFHIDLRCNFLLPVII